MNTDCPNEDIRIIRIRDVIALTGLSRSAIYAAVKAGISPTGKAVDSFGRMGEGGGGRVVEGAPAWPVASASATRTAGQGPDAGQS
jgi:hypothetical protein